MKHNGVVNIKPNDTQLVKAVAKFKTKDLEFINEDTTRNQYTYYIDVKVVAIILTTCSY